MSEQLQKITKYAVHQVCDMQIAKTSVQGTETALKLMDQPHPSVPSLVNHALALHLRTRFVGDDPGQIDLHYPLISMYCRRGTLKFFPSYPHPHVLACASACSAGKLPLTSPMWT